MNLTSRTPQRAGTAADSARALASTARDAGQPSESAANPVVEFPFCEHLSASGIDATPLELPWKVWQCDACGWRYRNELEDGITYMAGVE